MTLDETIERLTQLQKIVGGDTPFCIEKEQTPSGAVNVFEPAAVEVYNVVAVEHGERPHWVCLISGNTSQIVVVY